MTPNEINIYEEEYEKFISDVRRVGKALKHLHIRLNAIASACIYKEDVICFIYFDPDEYGIYRFPKILLTYTDDELKIYAREKIKERELKEQEERKKYDLETYYRIQEKYKL